MAADGGDDDVFVYLGGEQVVPNGVTHAVIDPSVNTVRRRAFYDRRQLVSVIFHDGVGIIEEQAFFNCRSLSGRIKLLGVREIGDNAFQHCSALSDVEFSDRLETIEHRAFYGCRSLRSIKLLSVRTVQKWAFSHCIQLTDVEFGVNLETIGFNSFYHCDVLQRIAIPLKNGLFTFDADERRYNQFDSCDNLTTVDLVGAEGINNTISSLLLKSWRNKMNQEINRINEVLPNILGLSKAEMVRLCIRSVINKLEHYKAEHNRLLKEHMTQLELAVWKASLERDNDSTQKVQAKRAKIDVGNARKEKCITSGADIIIKNVIPFLKLA